MENGFKKFNQKLDDSIEKYSAKNFKQVEVIEVSEKFAPTSTSEKIRISFSLAAKESFCCDKCM